MIRELIFMLGGQTGALFVKNQNGQFEICIGIANLSPSEKESLKPLLKIGSTVSFLNDFIERKNVSSLYRNAVQQAIGKCLEEYNQTLVEIEENILDGSTLLGIAGIQAQVLPFMIQLEYLREFVQAVELLDGNSCIIDTVKHFRDHCGVAQIITTFQAIYLDCLRVLHKQLVSWLLFGKLLDPHDEFFIVSQSKEFVIRGERIPDCLNITLAQHVLFVGESVVALSEAQDLSEEDWEFMGELQQIPFEHLTEMIHRSRDNMAKRLWTQVSENGRLKRSLNMIRNTLLMKKGDVFADFIQRAESLLENYNSPAQLVSSQFAINQHLMTSLKKYLAEEEAEIERLSLNLKPDIPGQGWDQVYLEYKSEWPLGVLIFTTETMETYNSVFRLLLKLRRIHMNLNQLWKTSETRWDATVLELRWNLQHVLIHLSQYIQTDVIEVQKSVMDRHMDKCQDFDNFRRAHAQFLVVIAAQTFLHVPAMQACFKDLMELALRFCHLFREKNGKSSVNSVSVRLLNQEFRRLVQLLFSLLNGMYQQSSGTSMEPIAQLLLRLDFNYYLTDGMHKDKIRVTE